MVGLFVTGIEQTKATEAKMIPERRRAQAEFSPNSPDSCGLHNWSNAVYLLRAAAA